MGRVLVVDDEELVRRASIRILENMGLDVMDVGNGREALGLVDEHAFDFVVLGLNMPEMDGRDVFEVLSKKHPDLPVVICTGYLIDLEGFCTQEGRKPAAFLRKPFRSAELHEMVAEILVAELS